jgi:hypothetical protein
MPLDKPGFEPSEGLGRSVGRKGFEAFLVLEIISKFKCSYLARLESLAYKETDRSAFSIRDLDLRQLNGYAPVFQAEPQGRSMKRIITGFAQYKC